MNSNTYRKYFCIILMSMVGCKKSNFLENSTNIHKKNIPPKGFFIENRKVPGTISDETISNNFIHNESTPDSLDPYNGDIPIILGQQLPNPYSVTNMQLAVNILYGTNYPITANYLYVKFKPSNVDELMTLDETENLELQDYPMDYELIQDGDYYQDPNFGTEEIPWLYTVVPINYNFPQSIQKQIIEYLYLPENNELLEDLAESMTLGATYESETSNTTDSLSAQRIVTISRTDANVDDFEFEPDPCGCPVIYLCTINPNCEGGGGGGGSLPTLQQPGIFVEEQTICGEPSKYLPVKTLNIVAKRWFKRWSGYTDDNGQFVVTKNFRNKVKVIAKTKNENARVSKVRGMRLWQILFPTCKIIGVFNGSYLPNIRYEYKKPNDGSARNKELPFWAAATTHNSIIEFKKYTTEFGLTQPPNNLHVMVTNWGFMKNAGTAPMWNKCTNNFTANSITTAFIANSNFISAGITVLLNTIKNQIDVIIGYRSDDYNCKLTSSGLRSIVYHEMGHAQHFAKAGCGFWIDYRNSISGRLFSSSFQDPYGDGNDGTSSEVIAVGEMWGNHCEKWYSERHYGNGPSNNFFAYMQNNKYYNGSVLNENANYSALESFNPNKGDDIHRWIPQGLPYDLWDNRNDNFNPIVDNVNGITINQSFNALQPNVRSIPSFKFMLLLQNGNNQQIQINELFNQYKY